MKTSMRFIIALAVFTLSLPIAADETEEKTPSPGFRMQSELVQSFVSDIKTATIRVYPSIIRTPTNTTFSTASQEQVVAFLNAQNMAAAVMDDQAIDPGQINGNSQFEFCQNDMKVIGSEIRKRKISEEYILVMEVLFPPTRDNKMAVFGIHCIILNNEGQNVFTFLLNSHHRLFVDAQMISDNLSEDSREKLIQKATRAGLEALRLQIDQSTD